LALEEQTPNKSAIHSKSTNHTLNKLQVLDCQKAGAHLCFAAKPKKRDMAICSDDDPLVVAQKSNKNGCS
jgi:hypothetical protein